MIDRRTDEQGLNIMQRVFDALDDPRGSSVKEIAHRARATETSVLSAIKRLQLSRCLAPASCIDGVWLYKRRKDAERPGDRRGGKRQQVQEAA